MEKKKITLLLFVSLFLFVECFSEKKLQCESHFSWVEYTVSDEELCTFLKHLINNKKKEVKYYSVYFAGGNDSLIITFVEEPSLSRSIVERSVAEVGLYEYILFNSTYFLLYPPDNDNITPVKRFKNVFLKGERTCIKPDISQMESVVEPRITTIVYKNDSLFVPN